MNIAELGFTNEELQNRVVNKIAQNIIGDRAGWIDDEDTDEEFYEDTPFVRQCVKQIQEQIQKRIDDRVTKIGDEYVLPKITQYIESAVLQETNQWGEKKGTPLTFTEYLVARAEAYMQEKVDWKGKTKEEEGYGWTGRQTRITHAINSHLHTHLNEAMSKVILGANQTLLNALQKNASETLKAMADSMKVQVTVAKPG